MYSVLWFSNYINFPTNTYGEISLIEPPPGQKNVGLNNEVALLLRLESTLKLC